MDTMYQRGKIQEESMYYEHQKHDGTLPLIGVNTYLPEEGKPARRTTTIELIRSTEEEKHEQIAATRAFQGRRGRGAPRRWRGCSRWRASAATCSRR